MQRVADWCLEHRVFSASECIAWKNNFAYARNSALQLSGSWFPDHWRLLLDCDEGAYYAGEQEAIKQALGNPLGKNVVAYCIPLVIDGKIMTRVNLIRPGLNWSYKYRHHETLQLDGKPFHYSLIANQAVPLGGPHISHYADGARSADIQAKHERDVAMLRLAWEEEEEPRYLYYLGLEELNLRHYEEAVSALNRYVKLESKPEATGQKYYAMLTMGRLDKQVSRTTGYWWQQAVEICPDRVEAFGELALMHGERKEWATAYPFALAAAQQTAIAHPEMVEVYWSRWRALDILTVALINLKQFQLARDYMAILLQRADEVPEMELLRIKDHSQMIERVLGGGQDAQSV
jgi:tetratricopeptide (TPR) repeat protein